MTEEYTMTHEEDESEKKISGEDENEDIENENDVDDIDIGDKMDDKDE